MPPGHPAEFRDNATIEILIDNEWHERRVNNDGEIIDQALQIQDMTAHEVLLVCVDASMEFRARQHGLTVAAMPEPDRVGPVI